MGLLHSKAQQSERGGGGEGGRAAKRLMLMTLYRVFVCVVVCARQLRESLSHPLLPPLPYNPVTATQLQKLLIDFKCNYIVSIRAASLREVSLPIGERETGEC